MMGLTNEDFLVTDSDFVYDLPNHSVIDVLQVGGFENIYADLVGLGTGGTNEITDTLVTPFGNFDIPTMFDAAALDFGAPTAAAAIDPAGFLAALDADWTTLVTDFSALF